MNALITLTPLTIQNTNQQGVDARLLHTRLGVRRQFGNWISERIEKYGFVENVDFVVFNNSVKNSDFPNLGENPKGGRPTNEYVLTLDMAKELCMVQNNEAGRKTRRYFIEVEKEFHAPTEQFGNPIQFNIPALQAMIDGALERQLAPLVEAITYKSGEEKGETKEVATGKQAGRIISMLTKLDATEHARSQMLLGQIDSLRFHVMRKDTPQTEVEALPAPSTEDNLYDIHTQAVDTLFKLSGAALKYKKQVHEQAQVLNKVREATQQLALIA